ncbi:hypothetical protein AAG906_004631 [Vitis piasezkii]
MYRLYSMCLCTPHDVLEMIPWDGCKAKEIASLQDEDCVGCKRCKSLSNDFLSVRVYLWHETTCSMGLAY